MHTAFSEHLLTLFSRHFHLAVALAVASALLLPLPHCCLCLAVASALLSPLLSPHHVVQHTAVSVN